MSQLTMQTLDRSATRPGTRRRVLRNNRMVTLRSSLPTGLVTLRRDIPEYLPEFLHEPTEETTPKVDSVEGAQSAQDDADTAAGKGGQAQW
jgi:hypothetical protein